jgi:hypothetical protein
LALDRFDCQFYAEGRIGRTMTTATPPAEAQPQRRSWWRAFRGWPRAFRWATYLVVVLVLALVAGLVIGVMLAR